MGSLRDVLWASKIPVEVTLAEDNVSAEGRPPVLFFLIPRVAYVTSVLPQALRALDAFLPPGEHAPWLSDRMLPLRWNIPVGALWDVISPDEREPWRLTLHSGAPPSSVLEWRDASTSRGALLNSLKEASFVARGSAIRVLELSRQAADELLRAASEGDLARDQGIRSGLAITPVSVKGRTMRVPVRVLLRVERGGGDGASPTLTAATAAHGAESASSTVGAAGAGDAAGTGVAPVVATPDARWTSAKALGAPLSTWSDVVSTSRAVDFFSDSMNGETATLGSMLYGILGELATERAAGPRSKEGRRERRGGRGGVDTGETEGAEGTSGEAGPGLQGSNVEADPSPRDSSGDPRGSSGKEDGAGVPPEGAGSGGGMRAGFVISGSGTKGTDTTLEPYDPGLHGGPAPAWVLSGTDVASRAAERVLTFVSVMGTRPPLSVPLLSLHASLAAPDGFLYVVAGVSEGVMVALP